MRFITAGSGSVNGVGTDLVVLVDLDDCNVGARIKTESICLLFGNKEKNIALGQG